MALKIIIAQRTLYDIRDSNSYRVRKLADGNVWMTENLRLVGSKKLTSADSNVSSDYTLPASSTSGWCTDKDSSTCIDKSMVLVSNDAAYGAYYNWYAATASTGTYSTVTGNTDSSICPKGWRLPMGGSLGEFKALYDNYSSAATMQSVDGPAFVLSGYRNGDSTRNLGSSGRYWSSTAYHANHAYMLDLASTVQPTFTNDKFFGFTVRCIAR